MIIPLLSLVAVLLVIAGVRNLRRSRSSSQRRPPLPPGPTPLPFLGNVLGMNKDAPYLTYTEWSKKYGDVVHARILGQHIILLNSERAAVALLEKRSRIYSDRPEFSIGDLFDFGWPTSSARYGARFRLHRRLLQQTFREKVSLGYRDKQLEKAYELLTHLLDDSSHYAEHFTTFSASVVMQVTYGYNTKGGETFVTSMQRASDICLTVFTPEIFALCIVFPFVKLLPAWFPGMGWKSQAAECRRLVSDGLHAPYAWVKRQIEQGNAVSSMVSDLIIRYGLDHDSKNPELVQAIKDSAGTLYAASVETTHATLLVFVYFMMNHPEVQDRAQAEIDRIVGQQRLPNIDDRPSLPYVDAILRETLRCRPMGPTGIPHATTEDDVYEGYHIPKGATVFPNVWAITRDEKRYPHPESFMPERFLEKDGTLNEDTVQYVFGFGRRICPGRHVGDASLWCAIVCILALFRIEKTEGSEDVKWTTGLAIHPHPFPCLFVLRDEEMDSRKLASLIHACLPAL